MFQKHIHKVKFYPSADDFTQAPLVMLVTNIMSGAKSKHRMVLNWSQLKVKTSSKVLYILAYATPQWNVYTSLFTGPTLVLEMPMAIACLRHRKRGIARSPARHTCSYVTLTFIPKDLNLRFCHPTLKCLHSAFHRTIISIGTWEWSHGLYSCWLRHLRKETCAKVVEPHWNQVEIKLH